MTNAQPTILALGEILWDLLPVGEKQLGGAPTNFAYHAHALGAHARIVSAVGADALGAEILARLDGLGTDRSLVAVDAEHPTGTVTVTLDRHGSPRYVIHEGVAWDFTPATAELMVAAASVDAFCFGTLGQRSPVSRQTIRQALACARPGALRVCDINFRQSLFERACVETSLTLCNVVKLNDEELPVLAAMLELPSPTADEPATLHALRERFNLRLVALTRGAKGSTLLSATERSDGMAETVSVVDTIGAGDAFTAAMTVGLLRGWDLPRLHRHASRLAAYVCSQAGGTPTVPREILAG